MSTGSRRRRSILKSNTRNSVAPETETRLEIVGRGEGGVAKDVASSSEPDENRTTTTSVTLSAAMRKRVSFGQHQIKEFEALNSPSPTIPSAEQTIRGDMDMDLSIDARENEGVSAPVNHTVYGGSMLFHDGTIMNKTFDVPAFETGVSLNFVAPVLKSNARNADVPETETMRLEIVGRVEDGVVKNTAVLSEPHENRTSRTTTSVTLPDAMRKRVSFGQHQIKEFEAQYSPTIPSSDQTIRGDMDMDLSIDVLENEGVSAPVNHTVYGGSMRFHDGTLMNKTFDVPALVIPISSVTPALKVTFPSERTEFAELCPAKKARKVRVNKAMHQVYGGVKTPKRQFIVDDEDEINEENGNRLKEVARCNLPVYDHSSVGISVSEQLQDPLPVAEVIGCTMSIREQSVPDISIDEKLEDELPLAEVNSCTMPIYEHSAVRISISEQLEDPLPLAEVNGCTIMSVLEHSAAEISIDEKLEDVLPLSEVNSCTMPIHEREHSAAEISIDEKLEDVLPLSEVNSCTMPIHEREHSAAEISIEEKLEDELPLPEVNDCTITSIRELSAAEISIDEKLEDMLPAAGLNSSNFSIFEHSAVEIPKPEQPRHITSLPVIEEPPHSSHPLEGGFSNLSLQISIQLSKELDYFVKNEKEMDVSEWIAATRNTRSELLNMSKPAWEEFLVKHGHVFDRIPKYIDTLLRQREVFSKPLFPSKPTK